MTTFLPSAATFLVVLICFTHVEESYSSGSTDSATIRAIESEVRRMKGTSDTIVTELKKQKDGTAALQNEFKWLHNEVKGMRKSLSDLETVINQTVIPDIDFIREKITDLNNFIFKIGKPVTQPKALNSALNNETIAITPSPTPSTSTTSTRKFKLF